MRILLLFLGGMWMGNAGLWAQDTQIDDVQAALIKAQNWLEADSLEAGVELVFATLPHIQDIPSDTTLACAHRLLQDLYFPQKDQTEKAAFHGKKAHHYYVESVSIADQRSIDRLYWIGECYAGLKDIDSMEHYWLKAIEAYERYAPQAYDMLGLTCNNLASNYFVFGYSKLGVHYRYKAVEAWEKDPTNVKNLATGYSNLGNSIETAMSPLYLRKALNLSRDIDSPTAYIPLADLGTKYLRLKRYRLAREYYNEAVEQARTQLEITGNIGQYGYDLAMIYSLIGETYSKEGAFDVGISYTEKAEKVIASTDWEGIKIYLQIKKALIIQKKNGQGFKWVEDALERGWQAESPMYAFAAFALANFHEQNEEYEKALQYNFQAIHYYASKIFLPNNQEIYFDSTFLNNLSPSKALAARLMQHGDFLLKFPHKEALHQQKEAEKYLLKALEFYESLRSSDVSLSYKQELQKTINLLQSLFLRQDRAEEAWELAEKGRITSAQLAFGNYQAQQEMQVGTDLLAERWVNKGQIARLEETIFEIQHDKDPQNDQKKDALYDRIFQLTKANEQLDQTLAKKFPGSSFLQYQTETASLSELQRSMDTQSLMLSYQIESDFITRYEISTEDFMVSRIAKPAQFDSLLKEFKNLTQDVQSYDVAAWKNLSHQLYQLLIPASISSFERLIIVPDKGLHYVPFELLCQTNEGDAFSRLSYLLRTHSIAYASSATLWFQQQKLIRNPPQKLWAGFAPTYEDQWIADADTQQNQAFSILVRNGQLALPAAQKEVQSLQRLMKGRLFTGEQATESRFKAIAPQYQILHLAMHTLLEDEEPLFSKFIFQSKDSIDNGSLTIAELYALSLNADLAVLSACNTGNGTIMPGEGVRSLSQAFTAAGCPSTLMSLWQVPDQETSDLMLLFYQYISQRYTKDRALQAAKLDYLNLVSSDRMAHPYFWAGFIQSGNRKPIQIDGNDKTSLWLWVLGGILIVGGLIWYLRK